MSETHKKHLAVPWTSSDIWVGTSLLFLLMAILGGVVVINPEIDFALFLIVGEMLFLVPVWWLGLRKYNVSWSSLGIRSFSLQSLYVGCGLMIVSFLFNLVYGLILAIFDLSIQPDFSVLFESGADALGIFIGGALVAPIVEEIIFRGFIFAGLRNRYGWKKAAVFSSALFTLIHMQPTAILPIFILGLIFAYLYHRSGSIWPAVIMHMSTNALGLAAAYTASEMISF